MPKLNKKVTMVLNLVLDLPSCKDLAITGYDDHYQLFLKQEQVAGDLTLADLRNISRQADKLDIIHHVDITNLVNQDQVDVIDTYVKASNERAWAFLHLIHKLKFQKPVQMGTVRAEVAV